MDGNQNGNAEKRAGLSEACRQILHAEWFCVLLLCVLFLAFGFANGGRENLHWRYQTLFLFGSALCCLAIVWSVKQGKLSDGRLFLILFALVFMARLCYVLDLNVLYNQHDVGDFNKPGNAYHSGYILYLLENGKLPDFSPIGHFQYYHPPLHHIICALFLKLQDLCGVAFKTATENLQLLTLFYSMVTFYASYRILKLLNVKGTPLWITLCAIGFHPTFFLFSGSVNNDCLSVMFVFLAVWAVLTWYKTPTIFNILWVAITIGLAMMAKLTAGLIAIPVAFLFFYRLLDAPTWKAKGRLIGQFAAFGVVCIPLGIGWQVRQYLLYDLPLTYVPRLSDTVAQYLGDYSTASRFFDWDSLRDFGVFPARGGVQDAEYYEHCIPLASLKMALFGEYSPWKDQRTYEAMGKLLFAANAVLVGSSLVGGGYGTVCLFKDKQEDFKERIGFEKIPFLAFLLYWLTMMVSYVSFCFQYPHFCSMDFRYIVPTVLVGCVWIAVLYRWLERRHNRFTDLARYTLAVCAVAFAVASTLLYPLYF